MPLHHLSLGESLLESSASWGDLIMYISLNSKGLCNLEANQAVTALEQMKESCDKTLSKVCGSGSSAFLHQGRDFFSLSCLCSHPGSSIPELCLLETSSISMSNPKAQQSICLQLLPNVLWGIKLSPAETHCYGAQLQESNHQ